MRALKDRRDLGFGIVVVGCGGVLGGGSIKRGVLGGVGEDGGRVLRPLALPVGHPCRSGGSIWTFISDCCI